MSTSFVKIENNVVTEHIIADVQFIQSGAVGDTSLWYEVTETDPKRMAGVGFTYNPELNCFIPPKPYDSWIFNETNFQWEAPTPRPTDGKAYFWFEDTKQWMIFDEKLVYPDANTNIDIASAMKLIGDTIAS
jgi:hypothetical protein